MTRQDFISSAENILNKYCDAEMAFSDTAVLVVNPLSLSLQIADSEDEFPNDDAYDVQEFLSMHPDPEFAGNWIIDADALEALADEYFPA